MSGIDFKGSIKLYKDYTKESYSFLVNDATLTSFNPLHFRKNLLLKWALVKKLKAINNKTEQNKSQYNLDRQAAKIPALSCGNCSKYEFVTDKDALSEKKLSEEAKCCRKIVSKVKQTFLSLMKKKKNQ